MQRLPEHAIHILVVCHPLEQTVKDSPSTKEDRSWVPADLRDKKKSELTKVCLCLWLAGCYSNFICIHRRNVDGM